MTTQTGRRLGAASMLVLMLVAASCVSASEDSGAISSIDPIPEEVGPTSTTELPQSTAPDPSLLIWNQPVDLANGVELPAVGGLDPGTLLKADFGANGPSDSTTRVLMTGCRNVAPGRWVIDGTLRGQGTATFTLGLEQLIEDMIVQSTVDLTFSGAGDFSFPYVPTWAEAPEDPLGALDTDGRVGLCSFSSGQSITPVPTLRYQQIPMWNAPQGSVQGYPLFEHTPESSDLSRSISAAVWLGTEIPFASLFLPSDDLGWGAIQTSNRPECRSVHYQKVSVPTVSVRHVAGGCGDNWPAAGPIVGHQGWNWIQSANRAAVARHPLTDGVVEVFGPDEGSVVEVLESLVEFENSQTFEMVGPASADEVIERRLRSLEEVQPAAVFTPRARVEFEDLVVAVYTSVQPSICNGCSGDELQWFEIVVEKQFDTWFARGGGGSSWDECLGLSSWSSSGQFSARSVLAGQPDWTIEELRDGEWIPLETAAGYWIETGDGTNPLRIPTVRTRDADGEVQDCALSNFVPFTN